MLYVISEFIPKFVEKQTNKRKGEREKKEMKMCFHIEALCMIIKLCEIHASITGSIVILSRNFKYDGTERSGFGDSDIVIILGQRWWIVINI